MHKIRSWTKQHCLIPTEHLSDLLFSTVKVKVGNAKLPYVGLLNLFIEGNRL